MPLIISDLDGTIALNEHRQHWLDKEKHPNLTDDERWEIFFLACPEDVPNQSVLAGLKALRDSDYTIAIFSGRSDRVKQATEMWLEHFDVPYNMLRMRKVGDLRPDEVVKKEMLEHFIRDSGWEMKDILFVLDDRKKVVDMWRALGLACFQVRPGDF